MHSICKIGMTIFRLVGRVKSSCFHQSRTRYSVWPCKEGDGQRVHSTPRLSFAPTSREWLHLGTRLSRGTARGAELRAWERPRALALPRSPRVPRGTRSRCRGVTGGPGSRWGSTLRPSVNEETQPLHTRLFPVSFPPLGCFGFFFSLPVSISDIICPSRVTHSHSPGSSGVSRSARPRHFQAYTKHTRPFQFRRSHGSRNGNGVIRLEIIIITDRKRVVLVAPQR